MTDNPRRPVLVTGATGMLGTQVVAELRRRGLPVRALCRRGSIDGVASVTGDLRDPASLASAVDGCEAVVHAGALLAGSDDDFAAVNVGGTARLAELAAEAGVERFVFMSSAMVYAPGAFVGAAEDEPIGAVDAYGQSKVLGEQAVTLAFGERATILRPGSVYRTGRCPVVDHAAMWIGAANELPYVGEGDTPIDFVHVDDVAELVANAIASDAPGGPFNVAGPAPAPYRALIETLARAVGREVRLVEVDHPAAIDPPLREIATVPRTLSIARAREQLGYRPTKRWDVELAAALTNVAT